MRGETCILHHRRGFRDATVATLSVLIDSFVQLDAKRHPNGPYPVERSVPIKRVTIAVDYLRVST